MSSENVLLGAPGFRREKIPMTTFGSKIAAPRIVRGSPEGEECDLVFKSWECLGDISLEERVAQDLPSEPFSVRVGKLRLGMANGDPSERQRKVDIGHASGYGEDAAVISRRRDTLLGVTFDGRYDRLAPGISSDEVSAMFWDRWDWLRRTQGPAISPHYAMHHTILTLDHMLIEARIPGMGSNAEHARLFQTLLDEKGVFAFLNTSATVGMMYIEEKPKPDGSVSAWSLDTGDTVRFWGSRGGAADERREVLASRDALRELEDDRAGAVIGSPERRLLDTAVHSAGHGVYTEAMMYVKKHLQSESDRLERQVVRDHERRLHEARKELLEFEALQPQSSIGPMLAARRAALKGYDVHLLDMPAEQRAREIQRRVDAELNGQIRKAQTRLIREYVADRYGAESLDIDFAKLYPLMRYKELSLEPETDRLCWGSDGFVKLLPQMRQGDDGDEQARARLYTLMTRKDPDQVMHTLLAKAYRGPDDFTLFMYDA